jgi:hypothetical protein
MRSEKELEDRKRVVVEILHEPWCYEDKNYKGRFQGELIALKFALGEINQNTELTWSKKS